MLCHILQIVLAHSPGRLTAFLKMLKMLVGVRHIYWRRSPECLKVFHGIFEDIFRNNAVSRYILVKYSESSLTFFLSDFIINSYVAWGGKTEIYSVDESKKYYIAIFRRSHHWSSIKKVLLKTSQFSQENNCLGVIEKRLQHRCFLVIFASFLKTVILKNICEQLLLHIIDRGIAENYGV